MKACRHYAKYLFGQYLEKLAWFV